MLRWINIRKDIKFIYMIIIYRIILDLSYYYIISPNYDYMGLISNVTISKLIESYLLTVLVILMTPKSEEKLSSIFLNIQLLIFLIPMLSFYGLNQESRIFIVTVSMCHILQCFLFKLPRFKKTNHIIINQNKLKTKLILIVIAFLSIILILIQFGLPTFKAFDLLDVYSIREQNIARFPLSYFVPWLEHIILPFIAVYSLYKKKYFPMILSILIQIFIFMVFAQKTYLFSLFVTFGLYYLKKYNYLLKGMYIGLSVLVSSTSLLFLLDKRLILLPSLFVRRVLFVPAFLKFQFYNFFSVNPKVHFADGRIGMLFGITSPYEKKIPYVVSQYLGQPDTACNTGYWGDAYANFGMLGVVGFSILLFLIIRFIENKTHTIEIFIVTACFGLPLYYLNDSALLTMLLTGGLLLLIFIFVFLDMKRQKLLYKNNLLKIDDEYLHEL